MEREIEIREILESLLKKRLSVDEATDKLLYEMGRGSRILVVDENLLGLDEELAGMNYTTKRVVKGTDDADIKRSLPGRVFVTRNGQHYKDDFKKYEYGLVWVISKTLDPHTLAKEIEAVLMKANFAKNLMQMIKV